MIEKAFEFKAKASCQPPFYIREINHQALQSNCPAYVTTAKVQTQATTIKNPRIKEPKPKAHNSHHTNNSSGNVETFETAW